MWLLGQLGMTHTITSHATAFSRTAKWYQLSVSIPDTHTHTINPISNSSICSEGVSVFSTSILETGRGYIEVKDSSCKSNPTHRIVEHHTSLLYPDAWDWKHMSLHPVGPLEATSPTPSPVIHAERPPHTIPDTQLTVHFNGNKTSLLLGRVPANCIFSPLLYHSSIVARTQV